ncbi:hypothetical protein SCHPADRAFT_940552 [Schizopora paradoxa]|uniref:Uncharacterized protein n=1 Tax=Schizopora paradoxa TaxID=27342 RepID=A0A0H2RV15_9AGAM|nr:hypothetical protein SCHPADRAFT_940552 [Schizopora paradoxa]
MRARQLTREQASLPRQRSDKEMKRTISAMIPRAKNGNLQTLQYLAEGVRKIPEFVTLEVFEAFLENLQASKVPSIESLQTSFALKADGTFRDSRNQCAFQAIQGLINATPLIRSKREIGELLVARWPDVLSWMWYFYIACFERNLANKKLKQDMQRRITLMFAAGCSQNDYALALAHTPGTIRLATLVCMLDPAESFLDKSETCLGTFTLMNFLQSSFPASTVTTFLLNEMLEALGDGGKLFVDRYISHLIESFDTPEIMEIAVSAYLALFMILNQIPKHPLSVLLRAHDPIAILTAMLHRALNILSDAKSGRFGSKYTAKLPRVIAMFFHQVYGLLRTGEGRSKLALQALQDGIMTVLIECAPLAFAFDTIDRNKMVDLLKVLTCLTTRIPVARQASAELERIESRCSVRVRLNSSTPDVRKAWLTFCDAIYARRTIRVSSWIAF